MIEAQRTGRKRPVKESGDGSRASTRPTKPGAPHEAPEVEVERYRAEDQGDIGEYFECLHGGHRTKQ
jgi:hypothetical protein